MNPLENLNNGPGALDRLIGEITVDAYGDDEQLWAFRQAFEDEVSPPVDGFIIGEPVSVIQIDYDGNARRGLTAKCRRENGSEHEIAACDVVFPEGSIGALYLSAYRKWLDLELSPVVPQRHTRHMRQHKAIDEDVDLSKIVELVVLSVKKLVAHCRLMGTDRVITLRASSPLDVVPGQILTVKPKKRWRYAGHPYLSGEIESTRVDIVALDLVPLRLEKFGMWDPKEHYWGEENEPIEEWAKPIIAHGPRREFEMEQVLPGFDDGDPFTDPIIMANEFKETGNRSKAQEIFMQLCQSDLRCLDAHAHLGNFIFDSMPEKAIYHYEVGLRIGELSLGEDFDGVLHWGLIDNRPFLRCIQGYGLCLWCLGRFKEAEHVFNRLLWLNPPDNQGVRFLIDDVKARTAWENREVE